jgi:hypothetical protein
VQLKNRTPCVGICSTTYGDLVCRGCKRFSHEIVQWNGYDKDQQGLIWERLANLRNEVLEHLLVRIDAARYLAACCEASLDDLDPNEQRYQLLRCMVRDNKCLNEAGLATSADFVPPISPNSNPNQTDTLTVLQALDAETYRRSKAHYERNFKVPL